jgi:TRAP-type mannitol/chloroaromatic compound transport system permease large subunit
LRPERSAPTTVSLARPTYITGRTTALTLFPMTVFEAVQSDDLGLMPMLIPMGSCLTLWYRAGPFGRDLDCPGSVEGGLALAKKVSCGGVGSDCGSGSGCATAAAMAKGAYPSMRPHRYSNFLTLATIAAGVTLDIMLPPSAIMVIDSIISQTNIGYCIITDVLPGLLSLLL